MDLYANAPRMQVPQQVCASTSSRKALLPGSLEPGSSHKTCHATIGGSAFHNAAVACALCVQRDTQSHIYSNRQVRVDVVGGSSEDVRVAISEPIQKAPESVAFLSPEDPWILMTRVCSTGTTV